MEWTEIASSAGHAACYGLVIALCLAGTVLSCLSLFGTWCVTLAALILWIMHPDEFPGIWTVVIFIIIAASVEIAETLASSWGVAKRGGSKGAGWAALGGGMLGMILGGLAPFPLSILTSLPGMMAGSFFAVYFVEKRRLQKHDRAAHIAMGAVISRVLVILLKVTATIGMIAALAIGIFAF